MPHKAVLKGAPPTRLCFGKIVRKRAGLTRAASSTSSRDVKWRFIRLHIRGFDDVALRAFDEVDDGFLVLPLTQQ
jgi:hypothetical protein